ncbi:MAG: hypothetical protein ABI416_00585, partial [Ginsengibacter sp.]
LNKGINYFDRRINSATVPAIFFEMQVWEFINSVYALIVLVGFNRVSVNPVIFISPFVKPGKNYKKD